MSDYSYQINEGYFVSLRVLAQNLKAMSHDVHQWGRFCACRP
jgi:hypothetical protein